MLLSSLINSVVVKATIFFNTLLLMHYFTNNSKAQVNGKECFCIIKTLRLNLTKGLAAVFEIVNLN